jgi:hypothetical protein
LSWNQTDFRGKSKKSDDAPAAADAMACTPTGCEKPGCAAKPDAA